jgi:hypothetical protein
MEPTTNKENKDAQRTEKKCGKKGRERKKGGVEGDG